MELFHTLQGEGFHTGKPAVFVRLAGCDVGCIWCDVKESWDSDKHPSISEDSIVNQALKFKTKFIVITESISTSFPFCSQINLAKNIPSTKL